MVNIHGRLAIGERLPPTVDMPVIQRKNVQCNSCKHIGLIGMCPEPFPRLAGGPRPICLLSFPPTMIGNVESPPCGLDGWQQGKHWVVTLRRRSS